jgi:hypothetical protein
VREAERQSRRQKRQRQTGRGRQAEKEGERDGERPKGASHSAHTVRRSTYSTLLYFTTSLLTLHYLHLLTYHLLTTTHCSVVAEGQLPHRSHRAVAHTLFQQRPQRRYLTRPVPVPVAGPSDHPVVIAIEFPRGVPHTRGHNNNNNLPLPLPLPLRRKNRPGQGQKETGQTRASQPGLARPASQPAPPWAHQRARAWA